MKKSLKTTLTSIALCSAAVCNAGPIETYWGGPANVEDNGDGTSWVTCPGAIVAKCATITLLRAEVYTDHGTMTGWVFGIPAKDENGVMIDGVEVEMDKPGDPGNPSED